MSVYAENRAEFFTLVSTSMPSDICMPIGVCDVHTNYDAWADLSPYIGRDHYDVSVFIGTTVDQRTRPANLRARNAAPPDAERLVQFRFHLGMLTHQF